MNILYLMFSFTTGGTERLLVDICNEMVKREDNIYLYIINDHYDSNMILSLDKKVNIIYGHKKIGRKGKIKAIIKLIHFIRKNKINVVHCNTTNTLEMLFLKKFLFRKVKVLYTIHSMNQFIKYKKKRIKYLNKICNQFIAISASVKQNAVASGIREDKIKIIYNAIDLNKFHSRNTKKFEKDRIVLGIVARIVPIIKGQDLLIEAMGQLKKKYPTIQCMFAGKPNQGEEQLLDDLKELAKTKDVEQNCVFLGNIEDIEGFLNQIDIFVLPSRHEGFGISLVEALVMGVPCISSNVDGPAEVSENGNRFVLFQTENSEDLTNQIEYVIDNFYPIKEKTLKSIDEIKEKYNIITMCNLLQKEYE